jgi:hypothetical protein
MPNSTPPSRLSEKSVGQFNARAWLDEGDQLLVSAKMMRVAWMAGMKRLPSAGDGSLKRAWAIFEGPPKACMLLLGYAVEMYLKAALTKAYYGCSEGMFDRDVRKRFGHELVEMARETEFRLSSRDIVDLRVLKDLIVQGARYPIKERAAGSYTRQQAERLWQSINRSEFTRLRILAIRIRKHADGIDMDAYDPARFQYHSVDADGYIAFRCGGRLSPRITYRLSSKQRASGEESLKQMRDLIDTDMLLYPLVTWDYAFILEDVMLDAGTNRTVVVQRPTTSAPRIDDLLQKL